jgi:hypothetical protein
MELIGDSIKFAFRSQRDEEILAAARYGIRVAEWTDEITGDEKILADRIDEWKRGENVDMVITLSVEELHTAVAAIKRNNAFERKNEGALFNSSSIQAHMALPEIEAFVSTHEA